MEPIIRDIIRDNHHEPIRIGSHSRTRFIHTPARAAANMAKVTMSDILARRGKNHRTQNPAQEEIFIVQPHRQSPSRWTAIMAMAGACFMLLLIINTARSIPQGAHLFSRAADSAEEGYRNLLEGGSLVSQEKPQQEAAISAFDRAKEKFEQAQQSVWFMENDPEVKNLTGLFEAGSLLAESGKWIAQAIPQLQQLPLAMEKSMGAQNAQTQIVIPQTAAPSLLALLEAMQGNIIKIEQNTSLAQKSLRNIEPLIPDRFREKFTLSQQLLDAAHALFADLAQTLPGLMEIMGRGGAHHTIIALQNTSEVRATGGFIGSFIDLTMERGAVTGLKLEDVYEADNRFQENIEAPEELRSLTGRWFFRDANMWPDFTVSGEKLLWFYEKEHGYPADTVIAVNQELLGKILDITGPIEVSGLSSAITAENYRQILTYLIETKSISKSDPKNILKTMLPIIQSRLFGKIHAESVKELLLEQIVQKDVLGYSKNSIAQHAFEALGMDGRMTPDKREQDYLSVSATSISGNKSDAAIIQHITHDTVVDRYGGMIDRVTVERTHTWSIATETLWTTLLKPFGIQSIPQHIWRILGKDDNAVWMRLYIPTGAELLGSEGVSLSEIKQIRDQILQKTYLTFVMRVAPGKTQKISVRYKVPFALHSLLTNTYRLAVDKQLGQPGSLFTKRLFFTDFMPLADTYPKKFDIRVQEGTAQFEETLNKNRNLAVLFAR